ncbi:MAG: hypothetical protein JRE58_02235 [Deltaproteobacteria bacterium]|nr:hypothetical protein [Deltaproteobacteria bacterium]
MAEVLFIIIAAAIIFILLWIGLYKRSKAKAAVSYSCSDCGERDCNCQKDTPGP